MSVSFHFSLLNKSRYNNKCGGDLSSMMNTHSRPPTNMLHKHHLIQHAEGQDKWQERIGWTFGLAKPPLTQLLLVKRWFVQCYRQTLQKFWNLKLNKLKMQNKCRSISMQFYKPYFIRKFQKWHAHNISKIEACIKFVPYTYTYACGKMF